MRYQVTTKLTPQQTLHRAMAHFGPQGEGLELTSQSHQYLVFQGGGGHVAVTVQAEEPPGAGTVVELETREWDYQVRQFMQQVGT
jgi:hypothetical protein